VFILTKDTNITTETLDVCFEVTWLAALQTWHLSTTLQAAQTAWCPVHVLQNH